MLVLGLLILGLGAARRQRRHEAGETEAWGHLPMALYTGETLKERVARGPLPAAEAVAAALAGLLVAQRGQRVDPCGPSGRHPRRDRAGDDQDGPDGEEGKGIPRPDSEEEAGDQPRGGSGKDEAGRLTP